MVKINPTNQDQWLEQAKTLSQALPFMRRYAGSSFVIKFGGSTMGEADLARLFAADIVLLKQVGINPVVVHGGGPQIGHMLERLKIKNRFIDGLRVTDTETVDIVEMVLSGAINKDIVWNIQCAGGTALGLSGKDGGLILAQKLTRRVRDEDSNIEKVLDLGFVGEPTQVNPYILNLFKESDLIPVIAPIGVGNERQTYNINADTAAGAIAEAVTAKRLFLLTDVEGILDQEGHLLTELSVQDAQRLIADGSIKGGMLPKVETCIMAVQGGVEAAVILDGRVPHALLIELFTEHGAGTMIRRR